MRLQGIQRSALLLGIWILFSAPGQLCFADSDDAGIRIEKISHGVLRLTVQDRPLKPVLDRLAQTFSVSIRYGQIPDGPVRVGCSGKNIKDLLQCVLGYDADLSMTMGKGPSGSPMGGHVVSVRILDSTFGVIRAPSKTLQTSAPVAATAVLAHSDPEQRADALQRLAASGSLGKADLIELYQQGWGDENGEVRALALLGLALHDRENSGHLIMDALRDRDASVRLAAVDAMELNAQTRPYLMQALNDTDDSVRALAGLRLDVVN